MKQRALGRWPFLGVVGVSFQAAHGGLQDRGQVRAESVDVARVELETVTIEIEHTDASVPCARPFETFEEVLRGLIVGRRQLHLDRDPPNTEHFPHNWLAFVRREQDRLLGDFVRLFNVEGQPAVLTDASREHLSDFLLGDDAKEGSLSWKVVDALSREKRALDSIRRSARRLKDQAKELKAAVAQDKDHQQRIDEHEREHGAYARHRVVRVRTIADPRRAHPKED